MNTTQDIKEYVTALWDTYYTMRLTCNAIERQEDLTKHVQRMQSRVADIEKLLHGVTR